MRVVVTLPNWTLNGVSTFSARLVRELRARGVDASLLLTGSLWRDHKPLALPRDVEIERLRRPSIATWGARWGALREHLEARAPCLYLPNHDVMHSVVAAQLSSRVGVVGIAHSDDPQHYEHARRLAPWSSAVVGVSTAIVEKLRGEPALEGGRIERIPYGVEASSRDDVAHKLGAATARDAPLRIVYAGRLEERQKRSADLLAIAHRLRARGVPFELTIAGDGPSRRPLAERIRADALEGMVRLVGTVAPDAMRALYRAHDVFLLPSAFEGLPLALLEAMGEGCVPVVSDVASGVPELVQGGVTGETVSIGDVDGFADTLGRLREDPARRALLATRAHAVVAGGPYGVEAMTSRYLALFSEMWGELQLPRSRHHGAGGVRPPGWGWRVRLGAPVAGWRDALLSVR